MTTKALSGGKSVHELQIHHVRPEAMADYNALITEEFPRIANQPEFQVQLFGSWTVDIGHLDTAVHLWEYPDYPGYTTTQQVLRDDGTHRAFQRRVAPMLRSRENQIVLQFAFWQAGPPRIEPHGIYELRSYLLKPGRLLEWETEWRRGLVARSRFAQPVGGWFSQLGELNYVHHMWSYRDLQARKENREAAWSVPGWAETVHQTVPLMVKMEANILRPQPWSPLN
ncbi:hypothetical protein CXG81DRAFT_30432 [Caulochytrium protostelioides]|uniref:NIPSNAP-domain-containing protein n=1 Tax=Caulochytrium protostelioides TaxID=1555241 RepID=A0A4P9WYF2_9FUNG|nr:NIPSNAP-domain-containing protein [Caulochytrium protostelioides]RKO98555.1 hypothetical protein CXG81DRAFT_30432 [Caulochytrium protostelioides]|eukprot:RKO98555.1 hypothetical protein CXG81DRAFT_30432 [Caulochytrium protostelioides]